MLVAVLKDFNKLSLEEVPTPEPTGFGQVVVRIKACGFCQPSGFRGYCENAFTTGGRYSSRLRPLLNALHCAIL